MDEWIARISGKIVGRGLKIFINLLDDILLLAGCLCILYGLSLWSAVITWIVGGLMLCGWAVLVGRVKVKNATN